MAHGDRPYDVVILGTGLAGSSLGAILARNGARTLLLDAAEHPRFAVGESTIAYTVIHLRLLAERYGVPEIAGMASLPATLKTFGRSSGVKKHFGFLTHRDGEEPDPAETNEFRIPKVLNLAPHFFRQDTDAYIYHAALHYGCDAVQGYRVEKVDITDDGVTVIGADGTTHKARFIVDASGFRSPLAEQFGLREKPSRLKHHARSIFTHMVGVDRVDDHVRFGKADTPPVPWYEGTMHHLFDRGWMWIIPFDNHKKSTNPMCSVGIQLDERKYPRPTDLTPEEDFWQHVNRFPMVARQLRNARTCREWVSTDRAQYSSTQTVGYRWCLMSHAAGFIDPLFSRGLSNTCEIINALSWRLLEALKEDDFAVERFRHVEELEQGLLDYNDALVNSAFISFGHYDLWNAVFRIWAWGSIPGARRVLHGMTLARKTGNPEHYRDMENVPYLGLWWPLPAYHDLFTEMTRLCEAVEAGQVSPDDAAARLRQRIQEADFIAPSMGFKQFDQRFVNPTRSKLLRMAIWAARKGPEEIKDYMLSTQLNALRSSLVRKRFY
jgi:tetracycline 7-halogenase / FADH2 O2-dependent halogenase